MSRHPTAVVENDTIPGDTEIDAFAFVGPKARIGKGVTIGAGAKVYGEVGDNVVIGANAVIGYDVTVGDEVMVAECCAITRKAKVGTRAVVASSITGDTRILDLNGNGNYIGEVPPDSVVVAGVDDQKRVRPRIVLMRKASETAEEVLADALRFS